MGSFAKVSWLSCREPSMRQSLAAGVYGREGCPCRMGKMEKEEEEEEEKEEIETRNNSHPSKVCLQ